MSDSGNTLVVMTNTQEPQNINISSAATAVDAVASAAADLKLYDTASHAVSNFTPIKPGQVGMYVCGATVQSSPHIGIFVRLSRLTWCVAGSSVWATKSRSCAMSPISRQDSR